jgi:hypothetical protein
VGQQLRHGHRLPCRRQARDVLSDRIVHLQLAGLGELHDRHRRIRARHLPDVPQRFRRREAACRGIAQAVACDARDVRRLHDRERDAGNLTLGHEGRDQLIDALAVELYERVPALS